MCCTNKFFNGNVAVGSKTKLKNVVIKEDVKLSKEKGSPTFSLFYITWTMVIMGAERMLNDSNDDSDDGLSKLLGITSMSLG